MNYQPDNNYISITDEKWRGKLFSAACILVSCVFLAEILNCLFNYSIDNLWYSLPIQIVCFIILPSCLNGFSLLYTWNIIHSPKSDEKAKNRTICLLYIVITICVQIVHYNYLPLFCIPCIAIFITHVFREPKLSLSFLIISIAGVTFSALLYATTGLIDYFSLVLSAICASLILWGAYYIVTILYERENEHMAMLAKSQNRHRELLEELKIEPLTGLYNRSSLMQTLDARIEQYQSTGIRPLIAILDLDNFKRVNDTYGHTYGDDVLISLSNLIKLNVAGKASAFRYGGEEFILVFSKQTEAEAYEICENLRIKFSQTHFKFFRDGYLTFSCGISEYGENWTVKDWLNHADTALYSAKHAGRNQTMIYSHEMDN